MSIKIITDSASDLSEQYTQKFDIDILPLTVHLDGKDYQDGIGIAPKKIYDAMRAGNSAKTSQVSPQAFKSIFTSYAEKNQPFIYLAFSSELSGTYQTAKMIEQEVKETYPQAIFEVIDTKCASLGFGLVVRRAAELAQSGASIEVIKEASVHNALHMEHIFTVDDLEYLYRGGRVSKTAAFIGTLLKIKPLLHVENGKLIPLEKIRGSKRVLGRMLEIMEARGYELKNQRIGISHGDAPETAQQLAEMITEKFGTTDIHIDLVGSVIGAHAGPGTIALFFLNDEQK